MTNSYDDEDGTTPLSGLDRDRVWREWGIDLQDTTRMADDPEWAQECLWRWRGGEYIRGLRHHRPAPGDLERLESIAAGHGDPTGKEHPDPLPAGTGGDRAWECIDWSEPPLVPAQYFPGVRGRLWERRRLARLKRSRLDDGAYGYDGPREWHPRIVGRYLPDGDMAERVHRAVPAIGAGVLMGRMPS
ncbi:hypothetical protein [Bifidobacterium adolescentis]